MAPYICIDARILHYAKLIIPGLLRLIKQPAMTECLGLDYHRSGRHDVTYLANQYETQSQLLHIVVVRVVAQKLKGQVIHTRYTVKFQISRTGVRYIYMTGDLFTVKTRS